MIERKEWLLGVHGYRLGGWGVGSDEREQLLGRAVSALPAPPLYINKPHFRLSPHLSSKTKSRGREGRNLPASMEANRRGCFAALLLWLLLAGIEGCDLSRRLAAPCVVGVALLAPVFDDDITSGLPVEAPIFDGGATGGLPVEAGKRVPLDLSFSSTHDDCRTSRRSLFQFCTRSND